MEVEKVIGHIPFHVLSCIHSTIHSLLHFYSVPIFYFIPRPILHSILRSILPSVLHSILYFILPFTAHCTFAFHTILNNVLHPILPSILHSVMHSLLHLHHSVLRVALQLKQKCNFLFCSEKKKESYQRINLFYFPFISFSSWTSIALVFCCVRCSSGNSQILKIDSAR